MSRRSVSTRHSDIFEYWKNKWITNDGKIISDWDASNPVEVVPDWDYPCCWGCGKPILSSIDKMLSFRNKYIKENSEDFVGLWNDSRVKSKLQRCHIIPDALGGEDKPSNLFLLCSECHLLSPDTTNPRHFYEWVYNRHKQYTNGKIHPLYVLEKVNERFESKHQFSLTDVIKILDDAKLDKTTYAGLKDYCRNHLGTHCSGVVDESYISVAEDWINHLVCNAVLNKEEVS